MQLYIFHFQSASLMAETAVTCLQKLRIYLAEMRTDEMFHKLLSEVEASSGLKTREHDPNEPPAKRQRQTSRKLKDYFYESSQSENVCHMDTTDDQQMKRDFFEAIDTIESSLSTRFNQEDLMIIMKIEAMLLNAINGNSFDLNVVKIFPNIDKKSLREELGGLNIYLKIYNEEASLKIKKCDNGFYHF